MKVNRSAKSQRVNIEKISAAQVPEIEEKLISFYKAYTMFSVENVFCLSDYYVVRNKEGNIVAGAQATPDHWKILELPGLRGKILLTLFSSVPFLNKLIKKEYQFITLEGIYLVPGYEHLLEQLVESLLATYNRNSAMLWLDKNTELYHAVTSLKLGIVNKLNKAVTAQVICKFQNMSKEDQAVFRNNPAYISGIDIT